jgi:hypothetical protein
VVSNSLIHGRFSISVVAHTHATRAALRHIPRANGLRFDRSEEMLWTVFVILLVLWLLGWIGFHALGAYIHIVLLLALIVLVIQLFSGRRPVV